MSYIPVKINGHLETPFTNHHLSSCSRGDFFVILMPIQREYSSKPNLCFLPDLTIVNVKHKFIIFEDTLIHIQFRLLEFSNNAWKNKHLMYYQIPWCIWLNLGRVLFQNPSTVIESGASFYSIDNTLVSPHSATFILECINSIHWVVFEVSCTNWLFDIILVNVNSWEVLGGEKSLIRCRVE